MFVIDTYTIIIVAVLLVMALLTPFINPFFRKPKLSAATYTAEEETIEEEESEAIKAEEVAEKKIVDEKKCTPISIVFTPNNNAESLARNLEAFLTQDYADYQVIVVAPKGDSETEDILKRFSSNTRLYTTFIPESSKYMSRKKLAITLGVKAAKHNWVMICDIFCAPQSKDWLAALAQNCTAENNLVGGFTQYDEFASDFWRFERFHTDCYLMREVQKGTAYRWNGNALLFRKDEFLNAEGFRGNLKYVRGEFDFIVNKYARKGSMRIENTPEATLIEETPIKKHWLNHHLFYMENRQHLQRSWAHRAWFNVDQWTMHLNYLMIVGAIIYGVLTQNWIITAAAALSLVITLALRISMGKKALNSFDIDVPAWKIIPLEMRLIWQNLSYKIRYWRADKYDFISHKL